MSSYNKWNNILGWLCFIIAAAVYISTLEPTTSLWDCGEYIASGYKLEVGHPPGAPFFVLLARCFSLLAGNDTSKVAYWINTMSALCSAFTILFLYWTITALVRKLAEVSGSLDRSKTIAIFGSGLVGALAFTFSDSFWFSAVEGEVYAMSSCFTAMVFWAMLRWERAAEEPGADRWIILISLMIGVSIGVHLLNLLAIPAIVFIYYFKKYKPSRKGFIITSVVSILLLGGIQAGLIPWIVKLSAMFELFFANALNMPFNTGTVIYLLLLSAAVVYGLRYTRRKKMVKQHTAILCFAMILTGYSSFFVLIIRSQANTPMDQNNPENAINLLSYLNRDQYGKWPLLYGQYYNAPLDKQQPYKDGSALYVKDERKGMYVIVDDGKNAEPNYDREFCTIFPRMWSSQENHEAGYKQWGNIKGERKSYVNGRGERETIIKPTFTENLTYFFSYQVGHMYLRYFMWNFVGRQNDIQGHGNITEGNWITGIKLIDEWRLGQQEKLTNDTMQNKARNIFFGLPLLLGITGAVYQYRKNKKDAFIVLLLFFFTGIAIVLYLNQQPLQPRERDYAFAGSFYAFAIWIGLGVYALFDLLKKRIAYTAAAVGVTLICLIAVPALMAKEGWNDHDRSHRTIARDIAYDYLNSCRKNAILFTHGDNDTFPLWYAQEVEGIRTDVRVVVLSYFSIDWYIDQAKRKVYDSLPLPLTLSNDQYKQGTRDYIPIIDRGLKEHIDIRQLMKFITSEDRENMIQLSDGEYHNYLPTRKVRIPVNKEQVIKNNAVPASMNDSIVPYIDIELEGNYIGKSTLMILDLLANYNWERPIYFGVSGPQDAFLGLTDYFSLEGLAYRLVPLKNKTNEGIRIDTETMYNNVMKVFKWGNLDHEGIMVDTETQSRIAGNFRIQMNTLASALIEEGKTDRAEEVLDRCLKQLPDENIPYDAMLFNTVVSYYQCGAEEKAEKLARRLSDIYINDLEFYFLLPAEHRAQYSRSMQEAESVLQKLVYVTDHFRSKELSEELGKAYTDLLKKYKKQPAVQ
jgi:tetratricopeptide (TPR) repeat protein